MICSTDTSDWRCVRYPTWHMWLHSNISLSQIITYVNVSMKMLHPMFVCQCFNYQLLIKKIVVDISTYSLFVMQVYVISIIDFLIWLVKFEHKLKNCWERHTLQSNANLLASMMAAFLSRSDSKANTKESPCFGCQNSACAAAFPPPRTPQS